MLLSLIRRDIRSRFVGSTAGWLWLLVNPLLLLGMYSLVFGLIFKARAPADLAVPFVVWLAVALWPWLAFSDGIQRASESIPEHAGLISKVPMRRELLVLSSTTAAFVLQLAGFLVVLLLMGMLGIPLTIFGVPNALLVLTVLLLLANGLGLIAATLRVFFKDFQQLLPTLLMLWFFLTPIIYAPELLPEELRGLVYANPLAGLMTDIRAALLEGQVLPGATTLVMLVVSGLVYALGLAFFRRMAPHFEDFL